MDKGNLAFAYNLMMIDRSIAKSQEKIAPGEHTIVVSTTLTAQNPGAPADIVLSVDGKEVARTNAKMTVPAAFTPQQELRRGVDLGSTVSRDSFERRPFKFDGKIETGKVELKSNYALRCLHFSTPTTQLHSNENMKAKSILCHLSVGGLPILQLNLLIFPISLRAADEPGVSGFTLPSNTPT